MLQNLNDLNYNVSEKMDFQYLEDSFRMFNWLVDSFLLNLSLGFRDFALVIGVLDIRERRVIRTGKCRVAILNVDRLRL